MSMPIKLAKGSGTQMYLRIPTNFYLILVLFSSNICRCYLSFSLLGFLASSKGELHEYENNCYNLFKIFNGLDWFIVSLRETKRINFLLDSTSLFLLSLSIQNKKSILGISLKISYFGITCTIQKPRFKTNFVRLQIHFVQIVIQWNWIFCARCNRRQLLSVLDFTEIVFSDLDDGNLVPRRLMYNVRL